MPPSPRERPVTLQPTSSTHQVDSDRLGQTDEAYADTTLDGHFFGGTTWDFHRKTSGGAPFAPEYGGRSTVAGVQWRAA